MDHRQYLSAERLFELCNEHLEDLRRPSENIRHKLIDIFVIGLLGIMIKLRNYLTRTHDKTQLTYSFEERIIKMWQRRVNGCMPKWHEESPGTTGQNAS